MSVNPFDALDDAETQDWEEVEDSVLACQKCSKYATDGRYYESKHLLTWVCPDGHKCEMKIIL